MKVKVAPFYSRRDLYKYMPRPFFDALEAAFLEGLDVAEVSAEVFNAMKAATPPELWPDMDCHSARCPKA